MDRRAWMMAVGGLAIARASTAEDGPGPADPPEFKILVASYAVRPEPISTEEIIARQGQVYQFRSGTTEVVAIDSGRKRVELIDLTRKVQAEVPFARIDEAVGRVSANLGVEIARREKSGTRADAIEAGMTRDMADPRFKKAAGTKPGKIRLTNGTIELDVSGELEPDPARMAIEFLALETIARLGAFLTPDDLPPFAELAALAALKADGLRPTELAYLYRLAGPPRKFRRTYRLAPELTVREREAVVRVDRVRETVPMLRYERYRPSK